MSSQFELICSGEDVAGLLLSPRHEQGSNPAQRQSEISAWAQDCTEAASSWLEAHELMSGHAARCRFYFSPSLLLMVESLIVLDGS